MKSHRWLSVAVVGPLSVLLMTSATACADQVAGQATVVDGDTLEIHGERIRLFGIDAPETRQLCADPFGNAHRCGKIAAWTLDGFIGQAVVTCIGDERDRYKRLIAVCYADGADLGALLVERGLAVAYRKYSLTYVPQEETAKAAGRGLWAGKFDMPWDWRKAHNGN